MILLATDDCALYSSTTADAHGWAEHPDTSGEPEWSGRGSLQLYPGVSLDAAAIGGGAGPFDPAAMPLGTVYLPSDSGAHEGQVLVARGTSYSLSQVRLVVDPSGPDLTCLVASVTDAFQAVA